MRTNLLAAAVAVAALGSASLETLAQTKPDVLVKQRQAAMTLQAKYLGPIGGMMKGSVPYNADIVARNATFLENLARMPWDGFDASTQSIKSRAKPEVFSDAAKFKAASEVFEQAAAKLGAAARAKDEVGVRTTFGAVAKACNDCHDSFQAKQ
jgi:cytochrome c556